MTRWAMAEMTRRPGRGMLSRSLGHWGRGSSEERGEGRAGRGGRRHPGGLPPMS